MTRPVKTELKYKVQWDGSIILKVSAGGSFSYVWQYCRFGSADWRDLGRGDGPQVVSGPGAAYRIGDKYRCLLYSGVRVRMYTSVLTVSEKTAEKAKEEESAHQRQGEGARTGWEEQPRQKPGIGSELFYFEGCTSFSEAESRYRQLMMKHHPDKGGNVETAKIINEQYQAVKARFES